MVDGVDHPIDRFVRAELAERGLEPSPPADRPTLLRRTSLALTGLPPTPAEVDAFVADPAPDAFERVVDRLLGSPAHAEHVATRWLDLARYADTNGYETDATRTQWPWRDELIAGLRRDEPFDRFTVRQLAGDLLPDATLDDVIAAAFHRNSLLNDEAGIDPEEFRVVAVKDRVDATARTWLGLSLDCAQCHDHPHDPITQREYYAFYAFFDSTADDGHDADPVVPVPPPEARRRVAEMRDELHAAERALAASVDERRAELDAWIDAEWRRLERAAAEAPELTAWRRLGPIAVGDPRRGHARPFAPERDVDLRRPVHGRRWEPAEGLTDGVEHRIAADAAVVYLHREVRLRGDARPTWSLRADARIKVWWDGRLVASHDGDDPGELRIVPPAGADEATGQLLVKLSIAGPEARFRFGLDGGDWPDDLRALLLGTPDARTADGTARLRAFARDHAPATAALRDRVAALRDTLAAIPGTPLMVMRELATPRDTRLLTRGNWLAPGASVAPGTPACLPPMPPDLPNDRLGLARWLVRGDHPLTARVAVNRVWAALFGRGLVATVDDFGHAGSAPSHPELLDWLARWFVADGWSLRRLHRLIVTSTTWQQASTTPSGIADAGEGALDPDNVWLTRGPRRRLTFEQIRDSALFAAGLLDRTIGGPSVMPPTTGAALAHSYASTVTDAPGRGATVDHPAWRRSLYLFVRRTAPHPAWSVFDGPRRDVCTAERDASTTPLQSLTRLNSPTFVAAAGGLAARVRAEAGPDDDDRLTRMFRLVLARRPEAAELRMLDALLAEARPAFRSDPDAARELCADARLATSEDTFDDADEMAAWIVVANALLASEEAVRLR